MRLTAMMLLFCLMLPPLPLRAATLHDPLWRAVDLRFGSRDGPVQRYYVSTRLTPARANLLIATLAIQGPQTPFRYQFPDTWGQPYFTWLRPAPSPSQAAPLPSLSPVPLPASALYLLGALAILLILGRNRRSAGI